MNKILISFINTFNFYLNNKLHNAIESKPCQSEIQNKAELLFGSFQMP